MLQTEDFLLWLRCRRRYAQHDDRDLSQEYASGEAARVRHLALTRRTIDVDCCVENAECHGEAEGALERTAAAMAERKRIANGCLRSGDISIRVDYLEYSGRQEGWNCHLFRAATGIRGVYATETALIALAMEEIDEPVAGVYVHYLDKGYRRNGELDIDALFRESNMTRRAQKGIERVRKERDTFLEERGTPVPDSYRCEQGCRLCVPQPVADKYSVMTLHKGRDLGKKLSERGIFDIREIPDDVSLSKRQKIQIEAVRRDSAVVQCDLLGKFLDSLKYPIFFLDFEAFSPSVPPFWGLKPYEHTPSLASIHVMDEPGSPVRGQTFAILSATDGRAEFYRWLLHILGDSGSIVVFSANFESAMLRQLAGTAEGSDVETLLSRVVDLLEPFARFAVYHPDQRGKLSLKRLLPIYTKLGYDNSSVADGMAANVEYLRFFDARRSEALDNDDPESGAADVTRKERTDGEASEEVIEKIVEYCEVDTLGMVYLLQSLTELQEEYCGRDSGEE